MAKSDAPLFGIDASGAVGKTVVYGKWKGIRYARRYVVPANPRTEAQTMTRDAFSFLNQLWAQLPPPLRAPWELFVRGRPLTDRNAFIGQNLPQLREATDLSGLVVSPGAAGGFALESFSATGESGSVSMIASVPTLPDGWTADSVIFAVLTNQDPHEDWGGMVQVIVDTSEPYEASVTGLSSGSYVATAFARYVRPDGKPAYGPSLIRVVAVS